MSSLRIGGIASGFDTDQIVYDLMRIERLKADKLYQNRQVMEWQKEQFREITNKVRSFRDTYFNLLRPETNLMSAFSLKRMQAISSNTEIVEVTAGADALIGETTFQVIQSATKAEAQAGGITGGSDEGKRLNLDDTMEVISEKLAAAIEGGAEEKGLKFNENNDFTFTLTINGESIVVNKKDSLRAVLSKINNSEAGVQAHYSTFSDTLTITAKETGAGSITTDDGGNFFSAFGFNLNENDGTGNYTIGEAGKDAKFKINGFEGTRASNTFTIEGLTYTINRHIDESDGGDPGVDSLVKITVSLDVDGIYETIEKFVNDYNTLIEEINAKLDEKLHRDFSPLTDEQKEEMKDKEIEKWEEKAQSGLLRRDPLLQNMLLEMRQALYESVGEGKHHLTEIGIMTSNDYRDKGKLVLLEGGRALKAAIAENPDKIVELFTCKPAIDYSPDLAAADRAQRYKEAGLAHRLSDILNDNIRTTRDNSGRKGILLERAGIEGDLSEINNFYDRKILEVNKSIDRVNEMLWRKEEQLYRQFTAMEKALQQLYAQGDWLMMQMSQWNS